MMPEAEVNGCHSRGSLFAEPPPPRLQTPVLPVSRRPASSTAGLLFGPPAGHVKPLRRRWGVLFPDGGAGTNVTIKRRLWEAKRRGGGFLHTRPSPGLRRWPKLVKLLILSFVLLSRWTLQGCVCLHRLVSEHTRTRCFYNIR